MIPASGGSSEDDGIDLPFDPETDVFWFYVAECEVKACTAEFYLNDIALIRNSPDGGYYHAQPVNQYILDGTNELAMIIEPGPQPSLARSGPPEGRREMEVPLTDPRSATLRLCRYPYGAVVGGPERQLIQELRWPQAEHEEPHLYPLPVRVEFERATGTGPWSWEAAAKLTLDAGTRAEIESLLNRLWASLAQGDPALFLEVAAPRFDDLAEAFEDPPYKKRNAFRRLEAEIQGLQPLDPDTFDLRLAAGGRMVECLQKDWQPVLRGAPDEAGNEDHYDMFLARLEGEWRIVR